MCFFDRGRNHRISSSSSSSPAYPRPPTLRNAQEFEKEKRKNVRNAGRRWRWRTLSLGRSYRTQRRPQKGKLLASLALLFVELLLFSLLSTFPIWSKGKDNIDPESSLHCFLEKQNFRFGHTPPALCLVLDLPALLHEVDSFTPFYSTSFFPGVGRPLPLISQCNKGTIRVSQHRYLDTFSSFVEIAEGGVRRGFNGRGRFMLEGGKSKWAWQFALHSTAKEFNIFAWRCI